MTEIPRTIYLDGELGDRFGHEHKLIINSPAEAVRALCCVIDGLQEAIAKNETGFHVFVDDEDITEDELAHPSGQASIRIMPAVIAAGGGGLLNIIVGAALIGAAFITGGASIAAWGAMQMVAGGLGAAMLFGGVAQMFMPKQKGLSGVESTENGASYHFNGPVNLVAQGSCVPVLYGEMWAGGVVVSAGIYNEDLEAYAGSPEEAGGKQFITRT